MERREYITIENDPAIDVFRHACRCGMEWTDNDPAQTIEHGQPARCSKCGREGWKSITTVNVSQQRRDRENLLDKGGTVLQPHDHQGRYLIKCDDCKIAIGSTDSLGESAAGGRCPSCRWTP